MRRGQALAAVVAVCCGACHVSYYARAGDEAARRGDQAQADADYEATIAEVRDDDAQSARIKPKLSDAAGSLVRQPLAALERRIASNEAIQAHAEMRGLLRALDGWGAGGLRGDVLGALERSGQTLGPRIDAAMDEAAFERALALAEAVAEPFAAGHPLQHRLNDLRQRAARHHLDRAAQLADKPGAWLVHANLAFRYGGQPVPDGDTRTAALHVLTTLHWRPTATGALLLLSTVETAHDGQGFQPLFAAGVGARLTTKWFNAIRLEIGYEFWPWHTNCTRRFGIVLSAVPELMLQSIRPA
jgi:hypothetical protein